MSAFMVCDTHIDALITAGLEMVGSHTLRWMAPAEVPAEGTHQRGEPWGPTAIEEYQRRKRELTRETAGRVGAMLLAENALSVQHRYDSDEPEEPYLCTRFSRPLTPVQVLKAIDCFEYQSCEHPEWKDSEAHAFCQALRGAMIDRLPGYDEADWEITGSVPEPKEESAPYVPSSEAIKRIRKVLKARCKTLSVRMGKGTAYGWVEIWGSGEYGNFTTEEKAALDHFGLKYGGNCCLIGPDETNYWVRKLEY